jgi:hypothetical protein
MQMAPSGSLSRVCYPRRCLIGKAVTAANTAAPSTRLIRVLNALLLSTGMQADVAATPGFALAAKRSVTVGADTAANRPSFFNSARRCLAVPDTGEPSFLPVLAMWIASIDLLSRDRYPRRGLIGNAVTAAKIAAPSTGPMRVLKALLLLGAGMQPDVAATPGFALAANRSVTVGADTAANRPSFFNSARRCLAVLDVAVVA